MAKRHTTGTMKGRYKRYALCHYAEACCYCQDEVELTLKESILIEHMFFINIHRARWILNGNLLH